MALNKLKYNSLNVTPVAGKAISFDSDPDALEATLEGGAMTFIKKLTASSSGTLSFVDGSSSVVLDNTYKEYIFIFNNIHPSADGANFGFNMSIDSGSNYNVTKTTTWFRSQQRENGTDTQLNYDTDQDLAQSTSDANIGTRALDNDDDSSNSGTLHLFNPSSTTFVKHFISKMQGNETSSPNYSMNAFCAGYGNTTSAVNAVQFKMSSGNIDAGTITLYGIN